LKWARKNGCPLDEPVFYYAAHWGNMKMLKWLWKQGCSWNSSSSTCETAASAGHLKVLKWLKKKGCTGDVSAPLAAAAKGNLEVLKWLLDGGCNWNAKDLLEHHYSAFIPGRVHE